MNYFDELWLQNSRVFSIIFVILAVVLCVTLIHDLYINKRQNINQKMLGALNFPVYWIDRMGVILGRINEPRYSFLIWNIQKMPYSIRDSFVDPEDYILYRRVIRRVVETGQNGELKVTVRNYLGEDRNIFIRIVLYSKSKIMLLATDVTETEQYRTQLEDILEFLPIPVMVRDRKPDGEYLVWNKAMENLVGIPAEEIKGKTFDQMAPKVQKMLTFDKLDDQLEVGKMAAYEHLECTLNDRKCVVNVYDSLIRYKDDKTFLIGSAIDITEQVETSKQMARLNQRYEMILKALGAMPWTWNLQTKTISCDRKYASDKYGINRDFIGKTEEEHYAQIAPEHREEVREGLEKLGRGEINILNVEYPVFYAEADTYLWVLSSAIIGDRDANGKPLTLVGSTTIIENRKQLEHELMEAKDKAEETNKLKSTFIANMSHEIRTPLNAIVGFSELLADMNPNEEAKQYKEIIEFNNRLLLQLVNDVIDLSKMESGTMEFTYSNVNVNNTIQNWTQSWVGRTKPGVEIKLDTPLGECFFYSEERRITQVMNNFMSNAVKNTEKGIITTGYYAPSNGFIRFYVRDTGSGIPADKLDVIFERFVKLNRYIQGTGLGLSICRMIADMMGGKVGVQSEEGKGSEFWLEVPFVQQNEEDKYNKTVLVNTSDEMLITHPKSAEHVI